jgi:GAF domain-containing protein
VVFDIQQAIAMKQEAMAMKEQALEMRLRLWLARLDEQRLDTSREKALEQALDAALLVASADYANIQLVHPSGRGLVLTAQRGFSQPFLDFFEFVDDGQTACGLALKEHRPVIVQDIIGSPIFVQTPGLEILLNAGVRAVESTPLIGRTGQLLGMLSVHFRQPRFHVDRDFTRLQRVACAVAALIDGSSIIQTDERRSVVRSQT